MTDSEPKPETSEAESSQSTPAGSWMRDWRFHTWAIIALAFIPRLIYLFQIRQWPFFYHVVLDSRTQYQWGGILVKTLGLGNMEVLAKAPLYSYFLGLNQVAMGEGDPGLFAARLVQLILGAVTCGLTYLLGRKVFNTAVGITAGLLAASYSPALFREGQLLDTSIATFLATAFLLALVFTLEAPTRGRWFGAGLLLALLGLTRPNLLLLAPVALVLLFAWSRKGRDLLEVARMAGLFVLGLVLLIAPITARNYVAAGGLVLISTNGAINFYTGNNPDADGYSPIPAGIGWERTWFDALKAGKETVSEQSSYWIQRGLSFWREQPGRAAALLLKKAYLYWNAYEIPNNLSYDWGRAHSSVLRAVPLTFGIVGPLCLLGMVLGGWRSRRAWTVTLFIVTQMVAVIIFFVSGRYRLPVVPAMCVLGGFALVEVVRYVRARKWSAVILSCVALALFGGLVNSDLYGVRRSNGANRDDYYVGQSYLYAQNVEEATAAFERAVEANPQDPDSHVNLGNMLRQRGDTGAAAEEFIRALEIAPDFTAVAAMLVDMSIEETRPLEEPARLLRRALGLQPTHVLGLTRLVRVNVRQGNLREADLNLQQIAVSFATWNKSDSRYLAMQREIMLATGEAERVGVPIPESLRPEPPEDEQPLVPSHSH